MCAQMVVLQPGVSISVIQVVALTDKSQQPLGVLAAKGQHPCSYRRGCDDSQGLASLWVYKEMY